jgi:uncharacterized protein YjaZ
MDRTWTLHWLQAAGTLAPWRPKIRAEIEAAFAACATVVTPPRVDIVIHQIPHWPVPELGFGGSAPSRTTMFLAFDTENPAMEANLVGGLRRVVLHEAHHCLRHAGPGYGNTLGEALVSEGLASRFVMEILAGEPEPWNVALDEAELRRVAAIAEPGLDDEGYDHDRWFIGRRNARRLPRWAGYSLGWRLVGTYLERVPDAKPSRLARVPAAEIISRAWDGVSGRAEMVSG